MCVKFLQDNQGRMQKIKKERAKKITARVQPSPYQQLVNMHSKGAGNARKILKNPRKKGSTAPLDLR